MTTDQVARHFLSFWIQSSDFRWKLADNAPNEFWKYIAGMPHPLDLDMVHHAVENIATNKNMKPIEYPRALAWLYASGARGPMQANKVMSIPKPPTTFEELVKSAYKYEYMDVADSLRKFFDTKLPTI